MMAAVEQACCRYVRQIVVRRTNLEVTPGRLDWLPDRHAGSNGKWKGL